MGSVSLPSHGAVDYPPLNFSPAFKTEQFWAHEEIPDAFPHGFKLLSKYNYQNTEHSNSMSHPEAGPFEG